MNTSSPNQSNMDVNQANQKHFPWLTCGIILIVLLCGGGLFLFLSVGGLVTLFGGDPEGLKSQLHITI